MTTLFGVDIAAEVASAMGPGLRPCELRRHRPGTRDPGNLAGGYVPVEPEDHPCRGILEPGYPGSLVRQAGDYVTLLGGTLPAGVAPQVGDEVLVDGVTFRVVGPIESDPARAHYRMRVER